MILSRRALWFCILVIITAVLPANGKTSEARRKGMSFLDLFRSTQYETAADIPVSMFRDKTILPVKTLKVTDGDTVRVRHHARSSSATFPGDLKEHTIIVRFAAVDAPEIAKRGKPGQLFSEEAKHFTEEKLGGKLVKLKLLGKDQYGRVLGRIFYTERYFFGLFSQQRDISEELLKAGLAVVYRQGGAKYDGSVEHWNALENRAKKKRVGIWSQSQENIVLPSEYKRSLAAAR